MRRFVQLFLATLLLVAILVYTQWPAPKNDIGETPEVISIISGVSDEHTGDSAPGKPPAVSQAEPSRPDIDAPELTQLAQSDDPFPHDLSMGFYWELVTSELRETPPEPKRFGDPVADGDEAYRLYVYYRWCANTLRTAELADKHLKHIVDRTVNAAAKDLKDWREVADFMFDNYEMCAPVPHDVDCQLEAFLWLSQAVRMGHEIAQTTYYHSALETMMYRRPYANSAYLVLAHPELIDEFKVTARFALSQAMEKGHPEAFMAMSQALLDGVVFPRGPVMAFAHLRAAELRAPPDYLLLFADGIERQKQTIAQHLDADQLLAAEAAAQELRRSHAR